ncbi:MAG TPA: hypothetical protein VIO38_11635, partial [Rariglobus sp.]
MTARFLPADHGPSKERIHENHSFQNVNPPADFAVRAIIARHRKKSENHASSRRRSDFGFLAQRSPRTRQARKALDVLGLCALRQPLRLRVKSLIRKRGWSYPPAEDVRIPDAQSLPELAQRLVDGR